MLSYDSVMKIPPDIRLHIIDAIDSRDQIIDEMLKKIEKKHDLLVNENGMLKKKIIEYENSHFGDDKNQKLNKINENEKTVLEKISSIDTKTKNEICESFQNHDYVYIDNKNDEIMPKPNVHTKIYDILHKYVDVNGHKIRLIELDNIAVKKLVFENDLLSVDAIETITPYDNKMRPRKFLSSLTNVLTDYVSENVHVEKLLNRLDTIINFMNNDKEFINHIFKNIHDFDRRNEEGKLGIIFKGGNVYKLFSEILDRNLDANIFHHYLSEINQYFKKSDCDFSLVFIAIDKNQNEKRFIHLNKTHENETMICTLQYMILNKFRNDFLHENNGYEYLNMCGINDAIITKKMKIIGEKMTNQIHEGRLDFESKLFSLMIESIQFVSPGKSSHQSMNYLNIFKSFETINKTFIITWPFADTQTLRGILKKKVNEYFNKETIFGVTNGNILDWYDVFLFYCMRNNDQFPLPQNDKFIDLIMPIEMIGKIQKIETDSMHWKDIKILYNVKETTNVIIGHNNYQIEHNKVSDEEIFRHIVSSEKRSDKIADILAYRMQQSNKLSSNRNDFFIKFSKNELGEEILNIGKIPFDNKNKSLNTPFYISVNKEISGPNVVLQKQSNIPYWLNNMKRYSDYGSSGFVINNNPSDNPFINVYGKLAKQIEREKEMVGRIGQKSINFSLSRLMLSYSIIFKTYDGEYFALPVSGEYIDLSYSYESDHKTLTYENYDGYILLNDKMLGHHSIETVMNQYNDLINYTKTQFINDAMAYDHSKKYSEVKNESDILVDGLYTMNYDVINKNRLIITNIETIINNIKIKMDPESFLKILKYQGNIFNKTSSMSFNTIFFPKLSGFILDLYSILFVDSEFPWTDQKYAKRLQRFIFFTFIEQLQKTNINNLDVLIYDMGLHPGIHKRIKESTQNTDIGDTFGILLNYNHNRLTALADYDEIICDENKNIQSVGAIDRFMFGYHLLDFLKIYNLNNKLYVRLQFIVKRVIDNKNVYILVSLNYDEICKGRQIIADTPNALQDFAEINNKQKVILPNNIEINRYTIIEEKFLKYIEIVCTIREKLIITINNYIHREILNSESKINIVHIDPIKILLNTYEGEIDKILRITS